ncbi:hypothetical protein ID866_7714 [Astraeus odoratus]|nr:hypothetical protein ID866_7714 [Astraeus odoratus]
MSKYLSMSSYSTVASAQPATLPFDDCFTGNSSQKMSVDTVYSQVVDDHMNITVFGQTTEEIVETTNTTTLAATLFTQTTTLTFNTFSNNSFLCDSLRPSSSLASSNSTYCPLAPGPYGLAVSIPFNPKNYFTTLNTELRALDPYGNEILCLTVATTPLQPGPLESPYGKARSIFWATIGLAAAYWIIVGVARVVSAWDRGHSRPVSGMWARVENAGLILVSAISGERLATSPSLLRFCSPSLRDIMIHTQWCAALAMVAVQWPPFVYPLLSQTAWATLTYNISLSAHATHWNPLDVESYQPPSDFADQLNDPSSILYLNASIPNTLFLLPSGTTSGMEAFAWSVGVRPGDLFRICICIFLAILAGTIALTVLGTPTRRVLVGNLVRVLSFFHLPVTIFSSYQFSTAKDDRLILWTAVWSAYSDYSVAVVVVAGADGIVVDIALLKCDTQLYQPHAKGSAASHHSGGPPPSVLRPEHALRPYREDSDDDDESTHIMGAWQPFPGPGSPRSHERAQSMPPQASSSGFSRVGGGRAHYDSPYAIAGTNKAAGGSTLTFPSVERRGSALGAGGGSSPRVAAALPQEVGDEVPTPMTSVANVARLPVLTNSGLPPGAMMPHARTKSQTAIIVGELAAMAHVSSPVQESHPMLEPEGQARNATTLQGGTNAAGVGAYPYQPQPQQHPQPPKKKGWFNIRRNRRHSDSQILVDATEAEDSSTLNAKPETGRSFVVIRDRKPLSAQPHPDPQGRKASQSLDESSPKPSSSFVVIRGSTSNDAQRDR